VKQDIYLSCCLPTLDFDHKSRHGSESRERRFALRCWRKPYNEDN